MEVKPPHFIIVSNKKTENSLFFVCGGGEIRTHEPLRAPVFKTGGINRYPTPPYLAERVGFEPTRGFNSSSTLAVCRTRPTMRPLHTTLDYRLNSLKSN